MTTVQQATNSPTTSKINVQQVALWTLAAGLLAALVNSIIFLIAQSQGIFEGISMPTPAGEQAFTLIPVIASSIIQIGVGGVVLLVMARFFKNPLTTWRNVAIVALVLSFGMPLSIPNGTVPFIVTLELMHVVAGIITIYLLMTRIQES